MFTPKLSSSSGILTTPGRNRSLYERKSNAYTPKGKSSMTGMLGCRPSISFNSSAASAITKSLSKYSSEHELVEFGIALPVLVTETLSMAVGKLSVKLHPCGWGWLICHRKLLIWNYKLLDNVKVGQCFELELPACSLPYDVECVTLLTMRQSSSPACLVVSPDGLLRYWFNVSLDTSFAEVNIADLRGELPTALVNTQVGHCVLATSGGSLVVIKLSNQSEIAYHMLRPGQGGGLFGWRRMSSLLFSAATPVAENQLRRLLVGEVMRGDSQALYTLCSSTLQKWLIQSDVGKMLYQCNIEKMFVENIAKTVWNSDYASLPLKTWLLDIQLIRDGIMLLGAGVNLAVSAELHYVIATLHTEGDEPPQSFLSFTVIDYLSVYEESPHFMPHLRMMFPSVTCTTVYLYDSESILCIPANYTDMSAEVVEFKNIGCGSCNGVPLFFSNQGLIAAVRDTDETDMSMMETGSHTRLTSVSYLETSIIATVSQEKIDELSQQQSELSRLKAAFLASIQDSVAQTRAQSIVNELFPPGVSASVQPGAILDALVTQLSQEMIDDYPASDPRWADSLPPGVAASSVSLILIHQLEDKLKAHDLYLSFLKNVDLWSRLSTVSVKERGVMPTQMLLCEHAEKLEAAKALYEFHLENTRLVDAAVEHVLEQRRTDTASTAGGLTSTDIFYREVSHVHELFSSILEVEQDWLSKEISVLEMLELVSTVNSVLQVMLTAAVKYRQSATPLYQYSAVNVAHLVPEFVSWTASSAVRSVIRKQHSLTVQYGLANTANAEQKVRLCQQLVAMADIMLDGYRSQLESIKWHLQHQSKAYTTEVRYMELVRKYEHDRALLLSPLMKSREYERAASLAEKYCDFSTLIEICEELSNEERLWRYMDQFRDNGFPEFVFKWYMDAGKGAKLMASSLSTHPLLVEFLQSNGNQYLSWLHDIQLNNYRQAHLTLMSLADSEREYAARKKTLLSLSKLASLAVPELSDDLITNVDAINDAQDLLLHQEQLPAELLENVGMTGSEMRVLSAKELIQMYISDYNQHSTEHDFRKALDLLGFVDKDDPDRAELTTEIWCRAILKDDWRLLPASDPVNSCRNTTFYRTLELLQAEHADLSEFPRLQDILESSSLGDVRHRDDFKFLIQATIEHLSRQTATSMLCS